jgi:hypothetical protein
LLLLFRAGERPDGERLTSLVEAAERLTVTNQIPGEQGQPAAGFELLRDGLTYDLLGLASGRSHPEQVDPFITRHRFGFRGEVYSSSLECMSLQPGPHLSAGMHSVAVVRTLASIAVTLAELLPGLIAVAWPPARSIVGVEFFRSSVSAWLSGGAFPSLGFAAFEDDLEGGIVSVGLSWFTGQEIRLANNIAIDRAGAAKLGVRLVNHLVSQGKLVENEFVVGPDGGRLALEPTRDGKVVRVRRA